MITILLTRDRFNEQRKRPWLTWSGVMMQMIQRKKAKARCYNVYGVDEIQRQIILSYHDALALRYGFEVLGISISP